MQFFFLNRIDIDVCCWRLQRSNAIFVEYYSNSFKLFQMLERQYCFFFPCVGFFFFLFLSIRFKRVESNWITLNQKFVLKIDQILTTQWNYNQIHWALANKWANLNSDTVQNNMFIVVVFFSSSLSRTRIVDRQIEGHTAYRRECKLNEPIKWANNKTIQY